MNTAEGTPAPIAFSVGASIADTEPLQRVAKNFQAFVKALHKNRAATKASAAYIAGPVCGRRCAEALQPRRWLALDLDRIDAETLPDLRFWLARFSGCGWPTHSSTPSAPRERAIIELDRDVTRAQGIAIGRALAVEMQAEFGDAVLVDASTFRGEQPVFLPPENVMLARFEGDPLNVERYLKAAALLPPDRDAQTPGGDGAADGKVRTNRNDHLSREAYRLRRNGLALEQIEVILQAMNLAVCDPPLDAAEVRAIAQRKHIITPAAPAASDDGQAPGPMFVDVDLAGLGKVAQAPQVWHWRGLVPAGHVTLLCGHGGAGKSVLALMLAACAAVGRPFLGIPTQRARVLYFSAEDPAGLVLGRLAKVCETLKIDLAKVRTNLRVIDATDCDSALFIERRHEGVRIGATTAIYAALADYVETHQSELVIVDNASDAYDGDEIARALVRGFMRALVRLVKARNGSAMLLAHVPKTTSRAGKAAAGESYSGSTAWHNSARSRLFLLEKEPGLLVLKHEKSNLGPKLVDIELEWPQDGLPQLATGYTPTIQPAARSADTRALVRLIREFFARGEYVTAATTTRTHAAKLLCGQPTYPAHRKDSEVFDLLRGAERDGYIIRRDYKTADRKTHERWELTEKGCAWLDSVPTAPTVPTPPIQHAGAVGAAAVPTVPTSAGGYGGKSANTKSGATAGTADPHPADLRQPPAVKC